MIFPLKPPFIMDFPVRYVSHNQRVYPIHPSFPHHPSDLSHPLGIPKSGSTAERKDCRDRGVEMSFEKWAGMGF
jgi:hypothetical protein